MKRFFTFLRKDAPKADANITMSIKGAFNTGGFGNDKTEGKGKYTFFFFAVPFIVALIIAFIPKTNSVYEEVKKNPECIVATVIGFHNYANGMKAHYRYVFGNKTYEADGSIRQIKSSDLKIGDHLLIVINKDNPEFSYPVKRLYPKHIYR